MPLFTEKEQKIISGIGQFFLNKNDQDFKKTEQQLLAMHITDIYPLTNRVIIVLRRPGLIIGKRGQTVEELKNFLGLSEIIIIEDAKPHINDFLIPYDYNDEY